MNNEEFKLPDEIFQPLKDYEAPYSEAAWGDMANLLDNADRKKPFLFWFQKNKNNTITLISITMITTTIITALALVFSQNEKSPATTANIQVQKPITSEETPYSEEKTNSDATEYHQNLAANSESKQNVETTAESPSNTPQGENKAGAFSPTNPGKNDGDPVKGEPVSKPKKQALEESGDVKAPVVATVENVIATLTPGSEEKKPVENTEVNQPNVEIPAAAAYTTFRGPWMGIHFTAQEPRSARLQDSNRQNFGFNWQFMSSNLLHRQDFGAHMGFDFGMQWYGRTKNYGVVLNNTELDSGFTRLSTHSFDLFIRGHFEYAKFRLKPYINGFAGPRIFATSQYTEAYRHKVDYENSSNTNAYTTASLMFGAGVGARLAISKHVSLDIRYEFMQGTETRMVDLNKSEFNNLSSFKLSQFTIAPEYQQIKFGVLFDLWDEYEEREYEEIQHNEVVQVSEYYYFDSSSNQYLKVNCRCSETPVENDTNVTKNITAFKPDHTEFYKPGGEQPRNYEVPNKKTNTGNTKSGSSGTGGVIIGGGGGNSGGGKGSFPGIKSGGGGGGGGIKIKH